MNRNAYQLETKEENPEPESLMLNVVTLTKCNMKGMQAPRSVIRSSIFWDCTWERANLSDSRIVDAVMNSCSLICANLSNVNLSRGHFINCNFSHCVMYGAILEEAGFSNCILSPVAGLWRCGAGGSRADDLYVVAGHDTPEGFMIKAGCFWGSLNEFQDRLETKSTSPTSIEYYNYVVMPALKGLANIGFGFDVSGL